MRRGSGDGEEALDIHHEALEAEFGGHAVGPGAELGVQVAVGGHGAPTGFG